MTTTLDRISKPMKPGLLCQQFSKQSFPLPMSRLDANILIPWYRTRGRIVRLQLSQVSTTGGTPSTPSMLDRHESFRSIASRQAQLATFSAPLVPGRSIDCSIDLECRRMLDTSEKVLVLSFFCFNCKAAAEVLRRRIRHRHSTSG